MIANNKSLFNNKNKINKSGDGSQEHFFFFRSHSMPRVSLVYLHGVSIEVVLTIKNGVLDTIINQKKSKET